MKLAHQAVFVLRALLAAAFVLMVVFQTLSFPGGFRHMAEVDPDQAHLRWPLTIWAALVIGCVQVVIVCTWRLLGMVRAGSIFTEDAFRWVDAILVAMATGWILVAGASLIALTQADDPGGPMVMLAVVLAGLVVVMLMVVMRELLRQATTLRADLDGVI